MSDDNSSKDKGLATLWRRRPLLTSAFVIALTLTLIFAAKAAFFYAYWTDQRQNSVARWMSPAYIARTWKIDIEDIQEELALDDGQLRGVPIARIARQRGDTPRDYVEAINELIREEHGEPPE